jgi:hypothetical protein
MHVLLHLGKYEDLGKTLEGITNCGVFLNSKFPLCFSYFFGTLKGERLLNIEFLY